MILRALALLLLLVPLAEARAEVARVAVASNFTLPAQEIARAFEAATGHEASLSFGSTGTLYAQIAQGAPHQVFLAADVARPERVVAEGLAAADGVFVYAVGRLALFVPDGDARAALDDGGVKRLAIANPVTAPYGRAAVEVLTALGLARTYEDRLVRGNNIAQTFQFVATGNADGGFVAASQVIAEDRGAAWPVPEDLHRPIAQAAVLLETGRDAPAARAFAAFLRGDEARAIIRRFGYGVME